MKILNISNTSIWLWGEGKGLPSVFLTRQELARRGHGVHFLCPMKEGEPEYSLIDGIHLHRFDFPFNFRKHAYIQTDTFLQRLGATLFHNFNWLFFQIFAALHGIGLGLKVKPDIVYANSLNSAFPAFLASVLLRAKLVIRAYGIGDLYFRRKEPWHRLRAFREYLAFRIPADYFIITDDGNYGDRFARERGVPEHKIKYWKNGIDADMCREGPDAKKELCALLGIDPSARIIASTSRLVSYYYGVDRLITVLAELFKRVPGVVCVMAGSGPDEKILKNMVRDKGIESRVYFTGIVDRGMIKKILCASDIFVLLARYHNCTNTVWEAMACGRCIVTTETEAIKEVLGPNDMVLVPNDRVEEDLPGILEGLLADDNRRNELGSNARRRVIEVLEPWPERAAKEADLLEALAAGRKD